MRPEDEWFKIPVPAIIERELFERARAQLQANFALCQRNKRNEYLLAGKIHCVCGKKRSGEGPQQGKHLYYRCNDRVSTFPLPPTCKERGINARIADKLVWGKIVELMSSRELLLRQAKRWMNAQHSRAQSLVAETASIKEEIAKLKEQEERYTKVYGAGLFTLEQLKEYVAPIRQRIGALSVQVERIKEQARQTNAPLLANDAEVDEFAQQAVIALRNLGFAAKRAIVLNTVEKVVASLDELQVYGYIPVTDHVKLFTSDRYGGDTNRHTNISPFRGSPIRASSQSAKLIPFQFSIKLPPPLRTGIDYGFLPGRNKSTKGRSRTSAGSDPYCRAEA
jgi:site-specific DNA recombinase